ncbi:N-acetylmuramoyl-L-alanine amidase [Candidatus Babeliales bacterium]|nr:N-acetylmuramoyl-L-alanine amidase [Candidatus Babeliales bacterium]
MIRIATLISLVYISYLFGSDDTFYDCIDDTEVTESSTKLGPKIYLFQHRDILTSMLESPKTSLSIIQACKNPATKHLLQTTLQPATLCHALQTDIPEIGCYMTRTDRLTTELQAPQYIVLIMSNTHNMDDHIQKLLKNNRAYNFIINTNGVIHPITFTDENVSTAITHYPFSLGPTQYVQHGTEEIQDMNARSITVSIIGKDNPMTQEQTDALIWLIADLQKKYSIGTHHVLDYACIAKPYGRRPLQRQIPWQTLAQANVTLWPRSSDKTPTNQYFTTPKTLWMSLALRKIGFACPATDDAKNQTLLNILTLFQLKYDCGQDPVKTIQMLNSLMIQHEECAPEKFTKIFPIPYKSTI